MIRSSIFCVCFLTGLLSHNSSGVCMGKGAQDIPPSLSLRLDTTGSDSPHKQGKGQQITLSCPVPNIVQVPVLSWDNLHGI